MQDVITEHGEIIDSPMIGGGAVSEYDRNMRHFYADFAKLQNDCPVEIANDTDSQQVQVGKYLTYAGMMRVFRPLLQKHNFIITHGTTRSFANEDKTRIYNVYTDLIHTPSGMFRRWQIGIPVPKLDAQNVGKAITYGKRYGLMAAMGVAASDDPHDDDGAGIQQPDIGEDFIPSDLLIELRDEIVAIKKPADLAKWGGDAKNKKRIAQLNHTEDAMIRTTYATHKRSLLANEDAS